MKRDKITMQGVLKHTRENEPICTIEQYESKGLIVKKQEIICQKKP